MDGLIEKEMLMVNHTWSFLPMRKLMNLDLQLPFLDLRQHLQLRMNLAMLNIQLKIQSKMQ